MAASLCALLQSNVALAEEQPHLVPTPDCPVGEFCCPSKIYCSHKEGCGADDHWLIDGGVASEGVELFNLDKISANRLWFAQSRGKGYMYSCFYKRYDGQYDFVELISKDGYKPNGNWEYSGFMNSMAECNTSNPLDCTGIKVD